MTRRLVKEAVITLLGAAGLTIAIRLGTGHGQSGPAKGSTGLHFARSIVRVGARFPVKGIVFGPAISVALITSPSCHFCQNSAGFHGRVASAALSNGVQMIVAVPSHTAAADYLSHAGLERTTVVEWAAIESKFDATPLLMVIDGAGVVVRVWLGELNAAKQDEVLGIISQKLSAAQILQSVGPYGNVRYEDAARAVSAGKATLVDVQEREDFLQGHSDNAVNIPGSELELRATFELDKTNTIFIDCSSLPSDVCKRYVGMLSTEGFAAKGVDAGRFSGDRCKVSVVRQEARR